MKLMRAPVALLLTLSLLSTACQSGQTTPSPSASQLSPSPSPSASVSPSPSSDGLSVAFTAAVPDKRWGDPPFPVKARASQKAVIRFSATGGCEIDPRKGLVTIVSIGQCEINVRATKDDRIARASISFAIDKARPVITFGKRTVVFQRPFTPFPLRATATPPIPLKYRVIPTGADIDDFCGVTQDGRLTMTPAPTINNFPQLDAHCLVEVSAAATSPNYETPAPDQARVVIERPRFDVRAANRIVTPVNGRVTVMVKENSGDALGMDVTQIEDDQDLGLCQHLSTSPATPPPNTTQYSLTFETQSIGTQYTCVITVQASPPDWQGGNFEATFSLTIKPEQ
jgi:hypothetical protein